MTTKTMDQKEVLGTGGEKGRGDEGEGEEGAGGVEGGVRTLETLLRVVPMGLCLAALVVMLKNAQLNDSGAVSYSDLGAFKYLVYANGVCAAYSLFSAFYTAAVSRSSSSSRSWAVFFFDQVLTYAVLAAGTVSAEIIYLAYKGDEEVTWSRECEAFGGFCRKATASVGITFGVAACYVLLSLISSYRLFSVFEAPPPTSLFFPADSKDADIVSLPKLISPQRNDEPRGSLPGPRPLIN